MKIEIVLASSEYYIIKNNGRIVRNRNGGAATFATEEEALEFAQTLNEVAKVG
jgi:hypothetical protein